MIGLLSLLVLDGLGHGRSISRPKGNGPKTSAMAVHVVASTRLVSTACHSTGFARADRIDGDGNDRSGVARCRTFARLQCDFDEDGELGCAVGTVCQRAVHRDDRSIDLAARGRHTVCLGLDEVGDLDEGDDREPDTDDRQRERDRAGDDAGDRLAPPWSCLLLTVERSRYRKPAQVSPRPGRRRRGTESRQ